MTDTYEGETFLDKKEKLWVRRMARCLRDMPSDIEIVANATSDRFQVFKNGTIQGLDDEGAEGIEAMYQADTLGRIDYSGASIIITNHV